MYHSKLKNTSIFLLGFLLTIALSSCATKLNFLNSSVVPAAQGYAKISKDDNGNYAVNVKVTNLADPSRLQPAKELFVVWLVTENNVTKNIGRLNINTSFFSSSRAGELITVSPFKAEYVFITAEDKSDIQFPLGTVVLTTKTH